MTDPMGKSELYTRDSYGRQTGKTDRNGYQTTYSYDGQLLQIRYRYDDSGRLTEQREGSSTKRYRYDKAGNRISFVLLQADREEISLQYSYDRQSRLQQVNKGEVTLALYTYDQNGNRKQLSHPQNGIEVTYSYNAANLLTTMSTTKDGQPRDSYTYSYYPDGNQSRKEYSGRQGTKVTVYTYDLMGRLTSESEQNGTAIHYGYDNRGNRTRMVTTTNGKSVTTLYTYDLRDRLLSEEKTGSDTKEKTVYTYDRNGNRIFRQWEEYVPANPEVIGTVGWQPAKLRHGVAISERREYNGYNQMVSLTRDGKTTTYSYRPDGLRHSKTTDGITRTHAWDGQEMVAEQVNGVTVERYLRGINLIAREQDNRIQYYRHNGHGDVTERTDEQGTALKRYDYDAFGNEQAQEPLDSNPWRYCGEYWDDEGQTLYLRARHYDAAIGGFLSEDSVRYLIGKLPNDQEAIDPLSLNLYTYCQNNPIANVDYSGHFSLGNIFNGAFLAYAGYAAITIGMAALTVATGGAALVAYLTVAAGVGAMALGSSEIIEGVTSYNPMRIALGDQLYNDSVMLASMGTAVGSQYSGQYYQMYGAQNINRTYTLDSNKIRFSQNSIRNSFSNGTPLNTVIQQLKDGRLNSLDLPPIRILERDGVLYTLDNRRLYVAQQANVPISYVWATEREIANESWKMTTKNSGTSITIR